MDNIDTRNYNLRITSNDIGDGDDGHLSLDDSLKEHSCGSLIFCVN